MITLPQTTTDKKALAALEMFRDDMPWIQIGGRFAAIDACKPKEAHLFLTPSSLLDFQYHYSHKKLWNAYPISELNAHELPSNAFVMANVKESGDALSLIDWSLKNRYRMLLFCSGQESYELWSYCRKNMINAKLERINGVSMFVARKW